MQTCTGHCSQIGKAHIGANIEMLRLAIWRVTVVSNGQSDSVLTDQAGLPSAAPCARGITQIMSRRKP